MVEIQTLYPDGFSHFVLEDNIMIKTIDHAEKVAIPTMEDIEREVKKCRNCTLIDMTCSITKWKLGFYVCQLYTPKK